MIQEKAERKGPSRLRICQDSLARRVYRYLREILFAIVEREMEVSRRAGPRENGYLDSWTVRGRPEDERRRCRCADLREMQGARGGFGGQKMGREKSGGERLGGGCFSRVTLFLSP